MPSYPLVRPLAYECMPRCEDGAPGRARLEIEPGLPRDQRPVLGLRPIHLAATGGYTDPNDVYWNLIRVHWMLTAFPPDIRGKRRCQVVTKLPTQLRLLSLTKADVPH